MLSAVLVGLLGAGFALNNHSILLPGVCQPCSASMLPCALYLLLLCSIGWHFNPVIQRQLWVASGLTVFFFVTLGTIMLWIFPSPPAHVPFKALWEGRLPKTFLSYGLGGGLFLYLDAQTKDRSLFRLHPSVAIWSKTMLAGSVGMCVNLLASFYEADALSQLYGHWLGFAIFALVGGMLLWLISYGLTWPPLTNVKPSQHRITTYHLLGTLFAGACVTANLMVVKHLSLFGGVVTAGLFIYIITFVLTDVISEVYDKGHAQAVVLAGFVSNVVLMGVVCLIMQCKSADIATANTLSKTFGFFFAIVIASIIAYLISQYLDIYLFALIRSKTGARWLWLRNNTATMISQTVDTLLFASIAWAIWSFFPSGKGTLTWDVWRSIAWQEWGCKLLLAMLDTPLVYLLVQILKPRPSSNVKMN